MTINPSPDDLLLIDEVAAITRRSVDALRWLRHKGEGPGRVPKCGRRLLYRRSAVMEWIAQQEYAQASPEALSTPPEDWRHGRTAP